MATLVNKLPGSLEFMHEGTTLLLPPDQPVECSKEFLKALAMYPAVRAYFDEGHVSLELSKDEKSEAPAGAVEAPAPEAPTKKKGK